MSNIDKRALRDELSNPAIGSNAHLRKLALALLDELEAKDKRIDELEARENVVIIKHPVIGRAYSALNRVWTEQEVRKACELAGIKLNIAAAGKGEAS